MTPFEKPMAKVIYTISVGEATYYSKYKPTTRGDRLIVKEAWGGIWSSTSPRAPFLEIEIPRRLNPIVKTLPVYDTSYDFILKAGER